MSKSSSHFRHRSKSTGRQSKISTPTPLRTTFSELQPKVTAFVVLVQVLSMIARVVRNLLLALYHRFFVVHAVPPLYTLEGMQNNGNAETRTICPSMPTKDAIAAQIVWNFMTLNQPLYKSDVAIVLGNYDIRTYQYACQLWDDRWVDYLLFTCGSPSRRFTRRQAYNIRNIAKAMNIAGDRLLIESASTNIIDNIKKAHKLLKQNHFPADYVIVVHLPYTERLVLKTFLHVWPGEIDPENVIVSSPKVTLLNYPNETVGSMKDVLTDLVETFDYVLEYDTPLKRIPRDIVHSYKILLLHVTGPVLLKKRKSIKRSEVKEKNTGS